MYESNSLSGSNLRPSTSRSDPEEVLLPSELDLCPGRNNAD